MSAGARRVGLGVAAIILLALVFHRYVGLDKIQQILASIQNLGSWGPVALAGIYILACVLVLPGSPLTLAGGFLFGVWKGYLAVAAGSVLGASAAFWIGRTVARDWVLSKFAASPKFAAIDRGVERQGFKMVLLTRLSPAFPFNIQNFVYGVTGVRFLDYFWATLIGMAPGTLMFVYFGSAMKNLADIFSGSPAPSGWASRALYATAFVATIAVTVVATRIARNALRESADPKAGSRTNES